MKTIFALIVAAAVLAGCGEKEPTRSVDWYKEHAAERKELLEKCRNHPGELENSPNCINAQEAEDQSANARRGWVQPNAIN